MSSHRVIEKDEGLREPAAESSCSCDLESQEDSSSDSDFFESQQRARVERAMDAAKKRRSILVRVPRSIVNMD